MNRIELLKKMIVVGLLLSGATIITSFAQSISAGNDTPPPLSQDPHAVELLQRVLSAGGTTVSEATETTTQGTIQFGTDPTLHPARIYTMGNDHVRAEIDHAGKTSVRILNAGRAVFIPPSGRARPMNLWNTITERVDHLPTFSLLADKDMRHIQLDYLGTDQLNGIAVEKIAASWSNAALASDQKEFLKRTRVVYTIDSATLQIVMTEYTHCADEDSNTYMHYRILYSNYTVFGGRSIPTTVTTYLNKEFLSELKVTSFTEGSSPSGAFDLPEVTR